MEETCGTNEDWSYRGEGNSSLVVVNEQERRVLRLRKCSTDGNAEKQEANRRNWVLCKNYIDNVMRPLLGEMFVTSPKLVKLTPEFVRAVNSDCLDVRPTKRLHAHADNEILVAMVMPDACMLSHPVTGNLSPTFCVEIKCKQGFLPPYSAEKSNTHKPVCRFCMLQQLKLRKGSLNHCSKFCPLDIFSGDHERMKHSLKTLLQTPQNNMKIFKDGTLFFSCHEGNPSSLSDLQSLVRELQSLDEEVDNSSSELRSIEECLQSNAVSVITDVMTKALLHVKRKMGLKDDILRFNDKCAASTYHQSPGAPQTSSLPAGCVLHSILSAQHMDTSENTFRSMVLIHKIIFPWKANHARMQ